MLLQFALSLDPMHPITWAVLAAGLALAALALCAGRLVGRTSPAESAAATPADAHAADRRRAPRRTGAAVGVLVSNADFRAEPFPAEVLDRSLDGLKLLLPRPVPEGALLGVRPDYPPGAAGAVVQVRHCRPEGERWVAGCKFLETPPWDTLARLLN